MENSDKRGTSTKLSWVSRILSPICEDFSTIAALLTEVMKKHVGFKWGKAQEEAFQAIKNKLINPHLLSLLNFEKPFEVECDASGVGIGALLMQDRRVIAYCSEKLSGATVN